MTSSATEPKFAPAVAPRAGADLRAARERIGWSLSDMAAALCIRLQHLEALEAGRIGELPGNAYALGFLQTYAVALGLDPREATRRFKAKSAAANQKTRLAFPVPAQERGVPAGAVVLLGVLLVVGAYAGWYRLSSDGTLPAETNAQVPLHLAPLAEQAARFNVAPRVAAVATVAASADPTTMPQPEAPPAASISPGSAAAAAVTPPPVPPDVSDQPRIVLRATADAWMQVRDRAGQILLNRTLHPGETWAVPARPNLLLTTGNAGGTDLVVDGLTSLSLGGNGVVRRDVPLEPDLIKDGKMTAAGVQQTGARPTTQ